LRWRDCPLYIFRVTAYRFDLLDFAFERMEFYGQGTVLGGALRPFGFPFLHRDFASPVHMTFHVSACGFVQRESSTMRFIERFSVFRFLLLVLFVDIAVLDDEFRFFDVCIQHFHPALYGLGQTANV
jgi:hypothetical protein